MSKPQYQLVLVYPTKYQKYMYVSKKIGSYNANLHKLITEEENFDYYLLIKEFYEKHPTDYLIFMTPDNDSSIQEEKNNMNRFFQDIEHVHRTQGKFDIFLHHNETNLREYFDSKIYGIPHIFTDKCIFSPSGLKKFVEHHFPQKESEPISLVTHSNDSKINDSKINESKPDETKPDESKSDETKPDETKPNETKSDEPKPDEPKPVEPRVNDSKSEESKSTVPVRPASTTVDDMMPPGFLVLVSHAVISNQDYFERKHYYLKMITKDDDIDLSYLKSCTSTSTSSYMSNTQISDYISVIIMIFTIILLRPTGSSFLSCVIYGIYYLMSKWSLLNVYFTSSMIVMLALFYTYSISGRMRLI